MDVNQTAFLTYIESFILLTDEEKSVVLSLFSHRKYLKGQYIVQQGDECKYQNYILKGCVKSSHIDKEGKEHILRLSIENWWASDIGSFLLKTPADFNVQCIEPTEVMQITLEKLNQLYIDVPKIEHVSRIILQREYVLSLKRIVSNLSMSAAERYQNLVKGFPEIERRVPQYLIASYLGVTKEFLSKLKSQYLRSL